MNIGKNYLKNVTKSLVFATADITKDELAPEISQFSEINGNAFKITYSALKNPKAATKKIINAFKSSKVYDALDYGARNAFDDLKTGKFYNKERDEQSLDYGGLSVDSFNDMSDFGIDDDWEDNIDKDSESDISTGDLKIANSVSVASAASAKTTANAIATAVDVSNKNSRTNTALLFTQNERLFGGLHNDLSVVNASLNSLLKLSTESFKNIDSNSSKYFTESVRLDTERNQILKQILEIQQNTYKSAQERDKELVKNKDKIRWSDISNNGIVDLKEYAGVIKSNVLQSISGLGSFKGFSEDSNMLKTYLGSPFKDLTKYFIRSIIPATLKEATRELNSTFSGVFGTLIARAINGKNSDDSKLGNFLGKIFGIRSNVNRNIDTSKYYKGPVPFDGITRKAIVDIIPTHLRRIEAAITHTEESLYDYNAGRWVNAKDVEKSFKDIRKNAVKSGTSDLRDAMGSAITKTKESMKGAGKNSFDSLEKAWDEFFDYLFENNGIFNPNLSMDRNKIGTQYHNLRQNINYKIICTAYKNFDLDKNMKTHNTKRGIRLLNSSRILEAKDNEEATYRRYEQDPNNIYQQYFGAGGMKSFNKTLKYNEESKTYKVKTDPLLIVKDNKNNNIFDYLQMITNELMWQRENMKSFGGDGRDGRKIKLSPMRDYIQSKSNKDIVNKAKQDLATNQKYLKTAISKIKNNKVADFRELDTNENKAIKSLEILLQNDATDEYANVINGMIDSNSLTKWMNKNIYGTDYMITMNDVNKAMGAKNSDENDDDKKESENDSDKKEESAFSKIADKYKKVQGFFTDIISSPAKSFTNLLMTADKAIYDMMFKFDIKKEKSNDDTEKQHYNGFMDFLTSKTSSAFEKISKKITEKIIDPLKEKFGLGDDFGEKTKDALKKTGKSVLDQLIEANKSVYKGPVEFIQKQFTDENFLAASRKNKRSDLNKKISDINGIKSMTNRTLLNLFNEYGLDITKYDNVNDAKKALLKVLYTDFYNSSKDGKELNNNADIASFINYLKSDDDINPFKLNEIATNLGIEINGADKNELTQSMSRELFKKSRKKETAVQKYNGINFTIPGSDEKSDNNYYRNLATKMLHSSEENQIKFLSSTKFDGDLTSTSIDIKKDMLINAGIDKKDIDNMSPSQINAEIKKHYTTSQIHEYLKPIGDRIHYLRQISQNAKGTFGSPYMGDTMLSKGELLFNKNGVSLINNTDAYRVSTPTHILSSYQSYPILKSLGINMGPRRTPEQDLANENRIKNKIANHADGDDNKANADSQKDFNSSIDKVKNKLKISSEIDIETIKSNAKRYLPEGLAGGAIGGLASLLLGIAGGPLIGALVGATGNIVHNSDDFKNYLFGDIGKDGKRQGGKLLNKKAMDAVNKYIPDMKKYGLAGIIPGLLTPLGPLGGILVGGAIGYLKNNETFSDKYYGKGVLGINTPTKNIIKKFAPNTAKGAGIGAAVSLLFGGPFGLLGNAALGSALGMMTATDEFKDGILGKEINGVRQGGLVGTLNKALDPIKDMGKELRDKLFKSIDKDIIDPLHKFIEPTIHLLPRIAGFVPRLFNKVFEGLFGRSIMGILGNTFLGKTAKFIGKKGITGLPSLALDAATFLPRKALGFLGNTFAMTQMNNGWGMGQTTTAAERIAYRNSQSKPINILGHQFNAPTVYGLLRGKGKASKRADAIDKKLASINKGDKEYNELKKATQNLSDSLTDVKTANYARRVKGKQIVRVLESHFDEKTVKVVEDILVNKNGKYASEDIPDAIMQVLIKGKGLNGKRISRDEFNSLFSEQDGQESLTTLINDFVRCDIAVKRIGNFYRKNKDGTLVSQSKKSLEKFLGLKEGSLKNYSGEKLQGLLNQFKTEFDDREANNDTNSFAKSYLKNEDDNANMVDIRNSTALIASYLVGDAKEVSQLAKKLKINSKYGVEYANQIYQEDLDRLTDSVGLNKTVDQETNDIIYKDANGNEISNEGINELTTNNKFAKYIRKGKINATANNINNLYGQKNIKIASKIINRNYKFDDSAKEYIGGLSKTAAITLSKRLSNKYIYNNFSNCKITKDDLSLLIYNVSFNSIIARIRYFSNTYKCKLGDCEISIADVSNLSINDLSKKIIDNLSEEQTQNTIDRVSNNTPEPDMANNAFGTILLGAGKLALGAGKLALRGAKAVGRGVKRLFSRNDEEQSIASSDIDRASGPNINSGMNPGNLVADKNGTFIQYVPEVNDYMSVKKNQDGSIDPDQSNAGTKRTLNKLNLKQKAKEKYDSLHEKAMGVINNTFGGDEKKKKKGMKWWQILLAGIVAAPFISKLFNAVAKPLFTNVIKPIWDNTIKPWWQDTGKPFVTKTLPSILGTVIGNGITLLITSLPTIIKTAVGSVFGLNKSIGNLSDSISEAATSRGTSSNTIGGINYSSGQSTSINAIDENGNVIATNLSSDEINSGEYSKLINENGEVATINSDGTYTFKNSRGSKASGKYARSIYQAAISGKSGIAKGVSKASGYLLKHGGIVGKVIGGAGKIYSKPIEIVSNNKLRNKLIGKIDKKLSGTFLEKAADKLTVKNTKIYKSIAAKKAEKAATKKITEKVIKDAATKGTKETVENAIENKGIIQTILEKVKAFIDKLFKNSKVTKLLSKGGSKEAAAAAKEAVNESIEQAVKEGGEEAAEKVGKDVIKNTLGKLLTIVTAGFDFVYGYNNASGLYGIKSPNFLSKLCAGAINALMNAVPFLTVFIAPSKILQIIGRKFISNFDEEQAEAKAECDAYNAQNGTNYSVEEYLNKDHVTYKIAKTGTKIIKTVGKGIKSVGKGIKSIGKKLTSGIDMDKITSKAASKKAQALNEQYKLDNTIFNSLKKINSNKNVDEAANQLNKNIGSWFGLEDENGNSISLSDSKKSKNSGLSSFVSKIKEKIANFWGNVSNAIPETVNYDTNNSSSTTTTHNGSYHKGSSHYGTGTAKQIDPRISGMRYNAKGDSSYQTIGDSGCGPVSAVNAVNAAYGMGTNNIQNAANYALSNGYKEVNGGTKPGFFGKYFSRNGLNSQTTSSKNAIRDNINSGIPTVLMGRDSNGTSNTTPFGKNPHYVTVTDAINGYAIVQDPESRYDNQLYKVNDIVNKASIGVSAFSKYGKGRGIGLRGSCVNEQIYNFFRDTAGFTAQAAAAAVGNMMCEAGTDSNGQVLLHSEEKTSNPNKGIGIIQWTGDRRTKFINYCANQGDPFPCRLDTELRYVLYELQNGEWLKSTGSKYGSSTYSISYKDFTQCQNIAQATGAWCGCFERPNYGCNVNKRIRCATQIFNLYSENGVNPNGSLTATTNASTVDNSSTTTSSTSGGLIQSISDTLGNAFNNSGISDVLTSISEIKIPGYDALFGTDTSTTNSDTLTTGASDQNVNYGYSGATNASAQALISQAASQIGYKEGPNNDTKYGVWYGMNHEPWCAMFVSNSANEAGIPQSIIPKYASTTTGYNWFKKRNEIVNSAGNGAPGDLVFFKKNGGFYHTGIVEDVSNGEVHTIEGNTDDQVARRTYKISDNRLVLARPAYPNSSTTATNTSAVYASADDGDHSAYGGNGYKPLSKYGIFKNSIKTNTGNKIFVNDLSKGHKVEDSSYVIGDSIYSKYGKSTSASTNNIALIKVIIQILTKIADNTDKLDMIASVLQEKLNVKVTPSDLSNATKSKSLKDKLKDAFLNNNKEQMNTDYLNSIMSAMSAIATE